jgi:hypothetical protein
MQVAILGFIALLIVIGGAGYFFFAQNNKTPVASLEQPVSQAPVVATTTPTQKQNELMAGGNSYLDPKGVFTLLYPNDYKQDMQGNGQYVRFFKTGATQRGQTEMYDGVLLVFEVVNLGDKKLSAYVDDKIKESTADGTLQVIRPKTSTTVNNYPAYTYATRGLGEATYYAVQKDPQSKNAVVIAIAVHDPEQKNYQKEVDSTLATLQLLK